ncbi:MAG: DnaJ C-terminal domain-containing protein [Flavonifractor plautii]
MGDLFGSFFGGGFGGGGRGQSRRSGPRRASTLRASLTITFEEAAFGCEKESPSTDIETCDACHGTGCEPGTTAEVCPDCHGTGDGPDPAADARLGPSPPPPPAPSAGGEGQDHPPALQGAAAAAAGVRKQKTHSRDSIPAGIDNGQAVSLRGQGERRQERRPGGRSAHQPSTVRPHELVPAGRAPRSCASSPSPSTRRPLGAELEIPTIDGKVKWSLPAGTQPGTTFRLRGKGIPSVNGRGRGDQYVTVNVQVPTGLTHEQKEALRAYGEAMGELSPGPMEGVKSFFDKEGKEIN